MTLAPSPAPNSPAWYGWRNGGLGASEIAATFGEHRFLTERALALVKRGLVAAEPENDAMRWGKRVEALGAADYSERTGRVLVPGTSVVNEQWPHLFATPDFTSDRRGIECKWTNRWDEPPRYVRIQVLAQIGICDLDVVDVVRMGPFGEPTWHSIERDDTEIRAILDWGEEWFVRYVLGDELPPVDGSDQTRHHLETLLGDAEMDATEEQAALMERIRRARFDKAGSEKYEALARNLLLASMAGHQVINGAGFRVTYRPTKARVTTNWEGVARAYRALVKDTDEDVLDALVSLHSNEGEPGHRFTPTWTE